MDQRTDCSTWDTRVSIVIPFRDEEERIGNTLGHLMRIYAPSGMVEIIAVNDGSTDDSERIAKSFMNQSIPLRVLNSSGVGKKMALRKGIEAAHSKLIVTIDADIVVTKNWLKAIVSFYEKEKPSVIILPLIFQNETTLFQRMQSVEFLSLMATTGAAALADHPVMCNGANLAFRKSVYSSAILVSKTESISSGDDMFLLFYAKGKGCNEVKYLKSRDALAYTESTHSFSDFINQRVRWASKAITYKDRESVVLGIFVFGISLWMVVSFFVAIFIPDYRLLFLAQFVVKGVVDFLFLAPFFQWFQKKDCWSGFVPMMVVYPFYAVLIPVIGLVYRPKWKGRRISLSQN